MYKILIIALLAPMLVTGCALDVDLQNERNANALHRLEVSLATDKQYKNDAYYASEEYQTAKKANQFIATAYNINKIAAEKTQDANRIKVMKYLEENFINKNKLGVATGEGFYTYPNPAFQKKDFLK